MNFDRRSVLSLLGGGAAVGIPSLATPQSTAPDGRFAHGVASGDPASDGAVIWTRVTAPDGITADLPLQWHVAPNATARPLKSGQAVARVATDHTVKIELTGLQAGQEYHYWFTLPGGTRSPTGRLRTLPVGATEHVVLALASCQLYPGGFFNAYADMAKLERLDAVVHLGDYIYEYGPDGYGTDIGKRIGRLPLPANEIVTLSDYRQRHAQVKADQDMQAAHARAAFICVWDDHESANDGWVGGAEEHDPLTDGEWKTRKAAAMQAYFEWMPIRDPKPGRPWEAINRSFEFGDLATLAMLETRLLARSQQVAPKGATPGPEQYAAMLAERAQPARELLGPVQQDWLGGVLRASVRAGKPWQVLGSQVVMARVAGVDLERELGAERFGGLLARLPEVWRGRVRNSIAGYRAGLPFNFDSWDGYPPARERLYDLFRTTGARPIVVSGDSHAAWANDLYDGAGRLVGAEFGTTAITSPSYGSLLPGLGALLARVNPEVAFCDQDRKGYTLLTLTPSSAKADFITVSTVTQRNFTSERAASWVKSARGNQPLARRT
jgi:alkaline phosphatase D